MWSMTLLPVSLAKPVIPTVGALVSTVIAKPLVAELILPAVSVAVAV